MGAAAKSTVFAEIRRACAEVAAEAAQVRLCPERLPGLLNALRHSPEAGAPAIDPTRHFLGEGEATAAFFVLLDTINFGSGWFPTLQKRPGHSGYYHMAACLTDLFRRSGPPEADFLMEVSPAWCAQVFEQDPAHAPAMELMTHFAAAWNALGTSALAAFQGRVAGLVEAAQGRAGALVELLAAMPYYRDVAQWRGQTVPFYKRAQLLAADLSLALPGTPWGTFCDLAELTLFADNLVPHVLRWEGALELAPALAARIDGGHLLASGEAAEVELRAVAVHAVEELARLSRAEGAPLTAAQLDYLLWHRGQRPEHKARPRPRCRTVFY